MSILRSSTWVICTRPETVKLGSCCLQRRGLPEQDISAEEQKPDLTLEIAYLLLIDVVGYSKLLVNEQIEFLQQLNQVVRSTESFRTAETSGRLIRVPTGDGRPETVWR